MHGWGVTFLVLAVVCAYFSFFGLVGLAAAITKMLLVVFLVLLGASELLDVIRDEPPR